MAFGAVFIHLSYIPGLFKIVQNCISQHASVVGDLIDFYHLGKSPG